MEKEIEKLIKGEVYIVNGDPLNLLEFVSSSEEKNEFVFKDIYGKGVFSKSYHDGFVRFFYRTGNKFEPYKSSRSVLTMTSDGLDTIDTFQNKNRGFKEDERERFRNY